jgi:hypothetical protein
MGEYEVKQGDKFYTCFGFSNLYLNSTHYMEFKINVLLS